MRSNLLAFSASPISRATSVRLDAAPFIAFIVSAAIGRLVDGLLVALGTYIVLFGIGQPLRTRMGIYAVAGLALLVALMLGMTASGSSVSPTIILLLAVALSAALGVVVDVGPPGPYFFVAIVGAGMLLAAAHLTVGHVLAMVTGGSALGAAFGLVDAAVVSHGVAKPADPPVTTVRQRLAELERWPSGAAVMCARMASALFLVGLASRLLSDPHPFWAVLVVVLILSFAGDRPKLRVRAAQRLLGTLVGVGVFVWIGELALPKWGTVALLCGCLYATSRLAARNYLVASIFITVLALELTRLLSPSDAVPAMALARAIDTVIAAFVTVLAIEAIPARRRDSPF